MVQGKFYRFSKIFVIYDSFFFVRKYKMKKNLYSFQVIKQNFLIFSFNPTCYVIELFWSGMAKDEDWIVAYSDIANICERIEK